MGKLAFLMLKIRNPAILTGSLYAVTFIFMLPFAFQQKGGVLDLATVVLVGIIAALAVHVGLNWIYYLVVVVPAVMAGVIFVSGLLVWLLAPASGLFFNLLGILATMNMGGIATSTAGAITEIISRFGQTLMLAGGALWWLTQKLGKVRYQALVVYLIALVILAVVLGVIKPPTMFFSLLVWAIVYLKVQGEENIGDLRVVFQIVASVVVLAGLTNIEVIRGVHWYETLIVGGYGLKTSTWATVYKWTLGGLAWAGIWFPGRILNFLPVTARGQIEKAAGWVVGEESRFLRI